MFFTPQKLQACCRQQQVKGHDVIKTGVDTRSPKTRRRGYCVFSVLTVIAVFNTMPRVCLSLHVHPSSLPPRKVNMMTLTIHRADTAKSSVVDCDMIPNIHVPRRPLSSCNKIAFSHSRSEPSLLPAPPTTTCTSPSSWSSPLKTGNDRSYAFSRRTATTAAATATMTTATDSTGGVQVNHQQGNHTEDRSGGTL